MVNWWYILMWKPSVQIISTYFLNSHIQQRNSWWNTTFPKKSPLIRQLQKKKSHHKNTLAPTSTANDEDFPHTLKIHAYFTLNIKYIVSMYNQHVQQFYSSIVFNLILSFTALYGVVVSPSLVKTTIKDRLVFCSVSNTFFSFKRKFAMLFVINLLAVFS